MLTSSTIISKYLILLEASKVTIYLALEVDHDTIGYNLLKVIIIVIPILYTILLIKHLVSLFLL